MAILADAHLHGVTEIGVSKQRVEHCKMVGHPTIIVAEIGDNAALRLLQGLVTMNLAFARPLRVIEETNATVRRRQFGDEGARRIGDAVAHNKQLEIL